jgi:hypothetical protein
VYGGVGYGAVVDLDVAVADVVDRTIVVEAVTIPISALVPGSGVAISVVNSTVVADVSAPVAVVVAIAMAVVSPPSGGPQITGFGWTRPSSGNPVITVGRPAPVAGSPDVTVAGDFWLRIFREWGRRVVGVNDWLAVGVFGAIIVVAVIVTAAVVIVPAVVVAAGIARIAVGIIAGVTAGIIA